MKEAFLVLMALSLIAQAQRQGISTNTTKYYFDITRPRCCDISPKEWQRIAANLKAEGVPAFFGLYDVVSYKENWKPVKLRRTPVNKGWLILGPFDSEAGALKVLHNLPRLLPNHMANEDERRKGVEKGDYPQNWVIGMYQISGFKTK